MAIKSDYKDEDDVIRTIRKLFDAGCTVTFDDNFYYCNPYDSYKEWDAMIEAGKSYMVGREVETKQYLKTHSSSTSDWQKLAYEWAIKNPTKLLVLRTRGITATGWFEWHIYVRGEYVEFSLPYHGEGGEKEYVVRIGQPNKKVLVNVG